MPENTDATLGELVLGEQPLDVPARTITPEQAQAESLTELKAIRKTLDAIRGWVVFGGIVLLIAIALAACNALMSV